MKFNNIFNKILQEKMKGTPNRKYIQKLQHQVDKLLKNEKNKAHLSRTKRKRNNGGEV
tara:strand:- start:39 stop:212 length:174 start_codon:yes stop_codon:yes gene_type:complete